MTQLKINLSGLCTVIPKNKTSSTWESLHVVMPNSRHDEVRPHFPAFRVAAKYLDPNATNPDLYVYSGLDQSDLTLGDKNGDELEDKISLYDPPLSDEVVPENATEEGSVHWIPNLKEIEPLCSSLPSYLTDLSNPPQGAQLQRIITRCRFKTGKLKTAAAVKSDSETYVWEFLPRKGDFAPRALAERLTITAEIPDDPVLLRRTLWNGQSQETKLKPVGGEISLDLVHLEAEGVVTITPGGRLPKGRIEEFRRFYRSFERRSSAQPIPYNVPVDTELGGKPFCPMSIWR